MKKVILVICTIVVFGGCSIQDAKDEPSDNSSVKQEDSINKEVESENKAPDSESKEPKEDSPETEQEKTEDTINEGTENTDSAEKSEGTSESASKDNTTVTNDGTSKKISNDPLFYEDGDRTKLETKAYYSVGDKTELIEDEKVYATVTLNDYKIVSSTDGNGRKGIAFFYTTTNTSNSDIEIGAYPQAKNPTFFPEVYYEDKNLKLMRSVAPTLKMDGEDYTNNKHVQYTEEDANMDACTKPTTLKPGESRDCYAHYSYAGTGNYLVGQISESQFYEWRTYRVNVTTKE